MVGVSEFLTPFSSTEKDNGVNEGDEPVAEKGKKLCQENHFPCRHFSRAGNAMKFDPLRCWRKKKIARVSRVLL